jgi:hypothetical protein
MKSRRLVNLLAAGAALLIAAPLSSQTAPVQKPSPAQPALTEQRLGVVTFGAQAYTVQARNESISSASAAKFATTLSELEIRGMSGNVAFEESFVPPAVVDDRFVQTLSVRASLLEGAGGRALVLRFLDESADGHAAESWQVFGVVDGRLVRYGPPLPLGQGSGIAVGGVLTGTMLSGGISVSPLASTADVLEFRAWTGNFFVYVPVRVDWQHGQWSEGEKCFALDNGTLQPKGCDLRIGAFPKPLTEGNVTLYAQPQEDLYQSQNVPVHPNSMVEFLIVRPLVSWKKANDRFGCSFDDIWLQVRIDGNEGWVHSAADFASLGLPPGPPPQ